MSNKLTDEKIAEVASRVVAYLRNNDSISNRKLRELTGVNYDQAIYFFNAMIERGELNRMGVASGTRYALPPKGGERDE